MKRTTFGIARRISGRAAAGALLAVLALGSTGPARAADLCIDFGFKRFVGRNVRIPKPDKCTAFLGHTSGLTELTGLVGAACTNHAGTRVDFSVTEHRVNGDFGFVPIENFVLIDLPNLTGNAFVSLGGALSGDDPFTQPVAIVPCSASDLAKE